MRFLSVLRAAALLGVALFTTACASGGARVSASPSSPAALRIYHVKSKQFVPFNQFATDIATYDIVFFGEQHDDPATHAAEHAVLAALGDKRPHVVLSLEMFERDVQPLLDQYLAGTISEANFLAGSRPWDRYATDYRPMVELARVRGWPVVASNVPRRLASAVGRAGLALLDTINRGDRRYMAAEHSCPKDQYYTNFVAAMGGHGPGGASSSSSMADRFYEAQCAKDEAMAEALVAAWRAAPAGSIALHVDGAFHSDYGLGTAERARRRAPNAKTVVLTAVPTKDLARPDVAAHADKAEYLLFTRAPL